MEKKNSMKQILKVLFFTILTFKSSFTVAMSCKNNPTLYFAKFENGTLVKSFIVKQELTGNNCERIPNVLGSDSDVLNKFTLASAYHKINMQNGIYQLESRCRFLEENECFTRQGKLIKLSNESNLENLKNEWLLKEQKETRTNLITKWFGFLLISLLSLISLFSPYCLHFIFKKKTAKQHLLSAVALQFTFTLLIIFTFPIFMWSHKIWVLTLFISFVLHSIFLLVEIGYLIRKKLKDRKLEK